MGKELMIFQLAFLLASVTTLIAVHYYIKEKLQKQHDHGLIWISCALMIWFVMGVLELSLINTKPIDRPEQYWYGRKIFSIINSAFFIYSLSYFKDGWLKLHKKISKINLGLIAGITIGLCLISYPIKPEQWVIIDTLISVFISLILFFSISAIFWQRGIKFMVLISVIGGLMLISTQIIELYKDGLFADESAMKYWNNPDIIFDDVIRMASRPFLVVCILVLAITWLGSQLEEELLSRPKPKENEDIKNKISFEERGNGKKLFVTITIKSEKISIENLVVEYTNVKSPFDFLRKCANETKEGKYFHRGDFTDNLETMANRVLKPINQKLEDMDFAVLLDKKDIFKSHKKIKGRYKLDFDSIEGNL